MSGCMPAVLNKVGLVTPFSSEVTSEALGMIAWPRFRKNSRNLARISEDCMERTVAKNSR